MSQFTDERGGELRDLFFETAQELLQSLNDDALKLEKTPKDAEIIRSIRRTVHTLKGDSAACGFQELSELAHMMEDALAVEVVTASKVSLAELGFTAADTFGAMLTAYRQQSALPETCAAHGRWCSSWHWERRRPGRQDRPKKSRAAKKSSVDGQQAVWTEYEKLAARVCAGRKGRRYSISWRRLIRCARMPIAARQLVANALRAVAQILGARPEVGSTANVKKLDLLVATSQPENDVDCEMPHPDRDF